MNDINPKISAKYKKTPNIKLVISWLIGITENLHIIYIIEIIEFTIINIFLFFGFMVVIRNDINSAKIEIIKYI
ncbi:hypothetical protein [uncultured Clostridium sp.]|uniref:hypothetical protein n=1 Tax=uncultured Clostridium sp. TaxID=59620 RepID=UPI0025F83D2A|nr:hypothetical protein [uncultured Clostridium sp.]